MGDFGRYIRAQLEVESAKNASNYAGSQLELKQMKCRYFELVSQHEPLNSILEEIANSSVISRDQLLKVGEYIIFGRFLKEESNEEEN